LLAIDPQSNIVTIEDIQHLFDRLRPSLRAQDQTAIVAQRIYQQILGFGVIDEIREMNIDGVSGGISGVAHDSVWVFYRGKSLHFSHLTFGSMEELKRVCQNIYKYNYPGQLSERNGYKVNQMADGSRVVVVRPPFAESWAFFVRKFDVPKATLEQLLLGVEASFITELLSFLVKGARVTAITGAQGSGKTTLLMALVAHIDPTFNIRVQEMSFELNLRAIYPNRNILSFRETDDISGQQGLDIQKKTDGTVNIIGEVASDPVAAWMIQAAQVASLFTLFTHHAKTFDDLVFALRNSLLKTGVFADEAVAEQQVTAVLHFNVHMNRTRDGIRYV
jgi:pilus assembly protein CpaF